MAKSRFRIIALRPITPQNVDDDTLSKVKSIQKKVFGKGWMYFYQGYKLSDADSQTDTANSETLPIHGRFLDVPEDADKDSLLFDSDSISVSVSAIVGPNGSGKSSAVELMIRILNNFSVAAKGESKMHAASEHLYFIEDVYGAILAAEDDHFFLLQVCGRSVKIFAYGSEKDSLHYECKHMQDLLSDEDKENKFRPIVGNGLGLIQLYNLFYTAIFNYSMYAFNYKDYYEERTIENRWINPEGEDDGVETLFDGEYTQDQCWLKGLFHKNDGYQTPIVLNPMRDDGIINVPKENALAAERVRNMLFYTNGKVSGHGNQPLFPFRIVNGHLEVVAIRVAEINDPKFGRDRMIAELGLDETPVAIHFDKFRETLCKCWSNMMCMSYQEDSEEERLAWDYAVYKTLKIVITYDKYKDAAKDLVMSKEIDISKIKRRLKEIRRDNSHVTLKLRQALNFLKYNVFRGYMTGDISLYDAYRRFDKQLATFVEMNIRMDEGQILANVPKGYAAKELPHFNVEPETGMLTLSFADGNKHPIPMLYMEDDGHLYMRYPSHQEILPPPIYDMQLVLIEKNRIRKDGRYNKKDTFPMSGLSSGERQIAGTISSFAYHLANIDSVWEDSNVKDLGKRQEASGVVEQIPVVQYKYAYVVFDEVELYFHPNLQRRYVKLLMTTLQNLHLKHMEGINILLVTHSPFVLSDLPRSNVLALGEESDDVKETFCANIHEMLGSSFFMDYTVGDLSRTQVEEILKLYNEFSVCKDKTRLISQRVESWERYRYVAALIADEYLHGLVERMMSEMEEYLPPKGGGEDIDQMILEAEKHLQKLRARKEELS